ncbi:MAG: CehA/McbA family metallohydrolase [Ignisphaera sp.]|nr:CehA/McbA family metallohydrolase [Ignisphaera sp.]MCX8168383.1 CehA/McbA family metallohydrolase [Ignisphaera sp.]MDW8085785.1 CehA/McbA family metallohydrolase [Ignisphaera sp.]
MGESIIKEFNGILYPRDKEISDYRYIQFTLPNGYTSIEIEYDFDRERGCIIDIGLIDSKNAFRGWSGSSKTKLYIDNLHAIPGYVAGEVYPGTWSVVLGLARIVECGCKYRIVIKMSKHRITNLSEKKCSCMEKKERGLSSGWIKGDLHVHTVHSDGRDDVCSLISKAIKLDLDYIAITDHNTLSQISEIKLAECPDILVIPGIEITTYYGHINTWGAKWFDFRRRNLDDFRNLIDEIHREGLLASLNHPFNFDANCIGCDFKYKELRGFDLIEVWNGPTPVTWNAHAVSWWHKLLTEGLVMPIVGGSDYHGGSDVELATPTTWVFVDRPTVEDVLDSIRRGRVFLSKTPNTWRIDMAIYSGNKLCNIGDRIDNVNKELKVLVDVEVDKDIIDRYMGEVMLRIITAKEIAKLYSIRTRSFKFTDRLTVDDDTKFVRVEIGRYTDPHSLEHSAVVELLALSNPIYMP